MSQKQKKKNPGSACETRAQLEALGVRKLLVPHKQEKAEGVEPAAAAPCTLVSQGRGVSCTPPLPKSYLPESWDVESRDTWTPGQESVCTVWFWKDLYLNPGLFLIPSHQTCSHYIKSIPTTVKFKSYLQRNTLQPLKISWKCRGKHIKKNISSC